MTKMPSDAKFTSVLSVVTTVAIFGPLSILILKMHYGEKWVNISAVRSFLSHILDTLAP